MVEIQELLAFEGTKPRPGIPLTPIYITIHNTANSGRGADADNHARLLRGAWKNTSTSWHYVVDDHQIYHCIPDDEVAWHAGDGKKAKGGNMNSLAIEICENSDGDLLKATDLAAELVAMLMEKYNIPLSHVVQHHDWKSSRYPSGKNCPHLIRAGKPYNWNTFLKKVQNAFAPVTKTPDIWGQAYSEDHWLPWVKNDEDYAGNLGENISAIKLSLSQGDIWYRVHTIGKKNYWSWVKNYNDYNSNGYAGVLKKPIDKIQMSVENLPGYDVEYKVHIKGGDWLGWVREYNNCNGNGYAGLPGKEIDAFRVRLVKE